MALRVVAFVAGGIFMIKGLISVDLVAYTTYVNYPSCNHPLHYRIRRTIPAE